MVGQFVQTVDTGLNRLVKPLLVTLAKPLCNRLPTRGKFQPLAVPNTVFKCILNGIVACVKISNFVTLHDLSFPKTICQKEMYEKKELFILII